MEEKATRLKRFIREHKFLCAGSGLLLAGLAAGPMSLITACLPALLLFRSDELFDEKAKQRGFSRAALLTSIGTMVMVPAVLIGAESVYGDGEIKTNVRAQMTQEAFCRIEAGEDAFRMEKTYPRLMWTTWERPRVTENLEVAITQRKDDCVTGTMTRAGEKPDAFRRCAPLCKPSLAS